MQQFTCLILATTEEKAASSAYLLIWTIGVLLAVLVVSAVLLSLARHRRPAEPRRRAKTPDPWEESARRLEVDEPPDD